MGADAQNNIKDWVNKIDVLSDRKDDKDFVSVKERVKELVIQAYERYKKGEITRDHYDKFGNDLKKILEKKRGEEKDIMKLTQEMTEEITMEITVDMQREITAEQRKDMEDMKPKIISDKEYQDNEKKLNKKPVKKEAEVKQEDIIEGTLTKDEFKRLSSVDFSKKSIPEIREIKKFLIEKLEKLTGISYAGKREEKRVESLDFIAKILQKSELQKVNVPGFAFTEKNLPLKPNKDYPLAFEGLSSSVRDVTLIRKDVTGITSVYQGSTIGSGVDREPHGLGTEIWANGDKYIGEHKEGEYSGRGVLISGKEKFDGFFNRGAPAGEMKVTLANGDIVKGNMNSFDVDYGVWEGIRINKNGELIGLWKENKYRVATEQDKKDYKKQKQI